MLNQCHRDGVFKMAAVLLIAFVYLFRAVNNELLCDSGFCRTYSFDVGCSAPMQHCRINNETHAGIWMPSPTECNCCEYCLPVYGEGHHCSLGGPGDGAGIGRCGDGLTCVQEDDGNHCRRMETECHKAQDEFDLRYENGEVGALEERPFCDAKGNIGILNCVPTQTCYCQSEEGQRIFGEVLYLGASTLQNTPCGCSRMNEKIKKMISPGVPHPVIGPRCTSDGNFNPVQCYNRTCFCVNVLTGQMRPDEKVDLDEEPITELSCYDSDLDLFPELSQGDAPYNYSTPCYEDMMWKINLIQDSADAGYIMDFYNSVPECLDDGTYGRILETTNGSKICVDPRGDQIGDYEALPNTSEYEDMNCNCALTTILMESQYEKPICCRNGNFRKIQCRRGKCHCVDENGRQITQEASSVTSLSCYIENWRSC